MDLAFNLGNRDFLMKSSQQDPMDRHALLINREATSDQHLSKWGMRMIQGSLPHLKDPLYYDKEGDCMIILRLMVYMYNFQTTQVGINQIMNLFMGRTIHFGHDAIDETANNMLDVTI